MNKDYLEDAQGRLVPLSIIKPMDLKRHEAVMSIMKETFAERERLIEFKRGIRLRVQDFLAESAKDSGARKFGGKKGNVTLTSYDGKYKVIVAVNRRRQRKILKRHNLFPACTSFAYAKLA